MDTAQQIATISAPAFETALRDKARETLATLDSLELQASPVTFTVSDIPVELRRGTTNATLVIAGGMYSLRLPLAWLTAGPT